MLANDDNDEQDAKRVTDRARATETIIASSLTTDFRLARYRGRAKKRGGWDGREKETEREGNAVS